MALDGGSTPQQNNNTDDADKRSRIPPSSGSDLNAPVTPPANVVNVDYDAAHPNQDIIVGVPQTVDQPEPVEKEKRPEAPVERTVARPPVDSASIHNKNQPRAKRRLDNVNEPYAPNAPREEAYPNTGMPANWREIANGMDEPEADAYPDSAIPKDWKAPDNKSEYEKKDETPVGKTVPDDFVAPETDNRTGLEKVGHGLGRGAGDVMSAIDRNYARIQAEQAAKRAARDGEGRGGKLDSAGKLPDSGSKVGASAGLAGGGTKPAGSATGSAAGASAPKASPSAGAPSAKAPSGKGGMGGGVRQGIDQGKNQLAQIGKQVGGKAEDGINKVVQAVDKVEQTIDKTATGLMVVVYVVLAWLAFIGSITFLFSTGFLGAIIGIFPLISPKYAYKIIVWILDFFGFGEVLEMAVDANNIKLNTVEKLIVGINAFLVLVAWIVVFGGMLVIMTYSICKTATTGVTGFVASIAAPVATLATGTDFSGALSFCNTFTSAIENATGLGGGTIGPGGAYNLAGYNIGAYATDSEHERKVAAIYETLKDVDFSTPQAVTAQLKKVPSTPLTGEMVLSSATKFNVDAKLMVALMMQDSTLGTLGKGARTHNPGNVGNNDAGNLIDYGTWEKGVDAVADWLNKHRAK